MSDTEDQTTITDDTAAKLREVAEKATPGPWKVTRKYEIAFTSDADDQTFGMAIPIADVFGERREADAAYIAAANPQTVLALLDKLEGLQRVIAWANNSLFGSHNFFLSANGGSDDEHHLDRKIEELKELSRKALLRSTALEAERDALRRECDRETKLATDMAHDRNEAYARSVSMEAERDALIRERDETRELLIRVHRADALSHNCPLWIDIDAALASPSPAPVGTHLNGKRIACDFPHCECSMGAAERCSHPPVPSPTPARAKADDVFGEWWTKDSLMNNK